MSSIVLIRTPLWLRLFPAPPSPSSFAQRGYASRGPIDRLDFANHEAPRTDADERNGYERADDDTASARRRHPRRPGPPPETAWQPGRPCARCAGLVHRPALMVLYIHTSLPVLRSCFCRFGGVKNVPIKGVVVLSSVYSLVRAVRGAVSLSVTRASVDLYLLPIVRISIVDLTRASYPLNCISRV